MENEREEDEEERVWSSNELLRRDSNNYIYIRSQRLIPVPECEYNYHYVTRFISGSTWFITDVT